MGSSAEMHKKRLLASRMSSGVRIITGTSRDRTPPNCYRRVAAHGVRCAKHRWPPTAARARACTGWELLLINRKSVRSKYSFIIIVINLKNFEKKKIKNKKIRSLKRTKKKKKKKKFYPQNPKKKKKKKKKKK